jgi:hypothetical protein
MHSCVRKDNEYYKSFEFIDSTKEVEDILQLKEAFLLSLILGCHTVIRRKNTFSNWKAARVVESEEKPFIMNVGLCY